MRAVRVSGYSCPVIVPWIRQTGRGTELLATDGLNVLMNKMKHFINGVRTHQVTNTLSFLASMDLEIQES